MNNTTAEFILISCIEIIASGQAVVRVIIDEKRDPAWAQSRLNLAFTSRLYRVLRATVAMGCREAACLKKINEILRASVT